MQKDLDAAQVHHRDESIRLIQYWLMNVSGSFIALVMIILYILSKKGMIGPRIFKGIVAIFAILLIAYGAYQLYVAKLLTKLYPGKYYIAGGGIAIILGAIILLPIMWGLRKK